MTDSIRRRVAQLRAGEVIRLADGEDARIVCAISPPVGTARRLELVDAVTGEPVPTVRLDLRRIVETVPGPVRWIRAVNHVDGSARTFLAGPQFVADRGSFAYRSWPTEIDLLGRPGWEELRRGLRSGARPAA